MSDLEGVAGTGPVAGYAWAIYEVARTEGVLDLVEDELFRFARTVEGAPELRDRLADPGVAVEQKVGIIVDLLANRALAQTIAAVLLVVQGGRARLLGEIADAVVRLAAASRSRAVAVARSAVPLDVGQTDRLRAAIAAATGKDIELKVVVDPDLLGGVVVRVGDTVIDGSVARRLNDLRARLGGV
jgi:F-type H+-transporting ATPase subunit delta